MSRKPFRLAAAAVTALSVATLGYGGSVAMAEEGTPTEGETPVSTTNKALIDASATVNLKINKYLGAPVTGGVNNGTEQTVTGLDPLEGVNFDVYEVVGVDLTTNAGWTAATALSGHPVTAAEIAAKTITVVIDDEGTTAEYTLELADTVVTNEAGQATFTKAEGVGLYLVVENLGAEGDIFNAGVEVDKASITPSAPFLVTLPMTNPETLDEWMYTVNVYPKNQTDTAIKEVTDKGTVTSDDGNVGDHGIDYTITTSITDSDDPLGMYVINDNLDPALTFSGVSLEMSEGTALVLGEDYVVYTYAEDADGFGEGVLWTEGTEVAGGPLVSIQFTEAGLAKLEANREANVVTTLNTILGDMDADGVYENVAYFIPNDAWWNQNGKPGPDPEDPENPPTDPDKPGIPTPEVESKYGKLIIEKQDPVGNAKLAGAEFAVFADPTPEDGTCSTADVSGTAIATGTTDKDGALTFTGLQASNWYNGAEVTDSSKWISYCLVETKAPSGYNLDATPHYITIDYKTAVANVSAAYADALVNNEKTNLDNELPLTGGQGIAALSLIGLALIGGGGAYYAASNRKRTNS